MIWRMDASVNLPQQAAPSPHDLATRLAATAAVRSQAFRFCSAEEVAGDIKNEFARYLAAVQTPEAILACAGESIPALKNYIFRSSRTVLSCLRAKRHPNPCSSQCGPSTCIGFGALLTPKPAASPLDCLG